jgi:hypothetical protein
MGRTLRARAPRHLLFEGLETRRVLYGDVAAGLDAGALVITGDGLSNSIVITTGEGEGQVTISGGKTLGQAESETTVNGQAGPVTLPGFSGEIRIDMQGGDDQVLITNLRIEGSLEASLGDGDDTLSIQSNGPNDTDIVLNDGSSIPFGPARMGVFVSVNGGDGNDTMAIRNLKANGFLAFTGGAGNDTFVQAGTVAANNRLGGSLTLNMGSGADDVSIQRLSIPGDLTVDDDSGGNARVRIDSASVLGNATISTPNGSDVISLGIDGMASAFTANRLAVTAHRGYDQITLRNVDVQDLVVHAGAGNNTVSLTHVSAAETLTVSAGDGADNISLTAVVSDLLVMRTWRGNDKVTLQDVAAVDSFFDLFDGADQMEINESIFSELTAFFGVDDDKLTFGNLTVVGTATFHGGDGLNSHTNLGGNSIGRLRLINFA